MLQIKDDIGVFADRARCALVINCKEYATVAIVHVSVY